MCQELVFSHYNGINLILEFNCDLQLCLPTVMLRELLSDILFLQINGPFFRFRAAGSA